MLQIKNRLKGLATGLAIALYGAVMLLRGKFDYYNSYSQMLYSPAVIATGILICCLSLVPTSWVDWIVRRK
jgi:hypothetical protein